MMIVPTIVRPSSIEGLGVFATTFIPAGAEIWKLDERFDLLFTARELHTLPELAQGYISRYGYPHMTKDGLIVLEMDNGRFMNHTSNPNTDFTRPDVGFAIVDIREGEEITCNYYEFDPHFRGEFDVPIMTNGHAMMPPEQWAESDGRI
jgi:uncharacterized protein